MLSSDFLWLTWFFAFVFFLFRKALDFNTLSQLWYCYWLVALFKSLEPQKFWKVQVFEFLIDGCKSYRNGEKDKLVYFSSTINFSFSSFENRSEIFRISNFSWVLLHLKPVRRLKFLWIFVSLVVQLIYGLSGSNSHQFLMCRPRKISDYHNGKLRIFVFFQLLHYLFR